MPMAKALVSVIQQMNKTGELIRQPSDEPSKKDGVQQPKRNIRATQAEPKGDASLRKPRKSAKQVKASRHALLKRNCEKRLAITA